ncbi:branched-chain amino acid ABC transporter permease [Dissulfurispira thermophila]|uniref:Branched-chain amino acid ABC transporter permease n=2 Tax=root TaxID=1 RepID=A0A7G1H199_9BACT|nr:branched-chain amino acid ABC transporter permease [Dissulfurispira thermophila]BCB96388.1 branched-chain amino acid ABC transporter permease [Dissulfurispira thermophila]
MIPKIKKTDTRSSFFIALLSALLFLPFKGIKPAGIMFISIFILLSAISLLKKTKVIDVIKAIRIPKIERFRTFSVPAMLILFMTFPLILKDYYIDVLIMSGIYILLALGLNIIVGFTGLLNLGFAAFYAIGAYTYAIFNTKVGLGFWASLPISASFAAIAGLLLAIPALRLRGDYLAIVTLGFGEIVRLILNNWDSLTNGPNGITGIARPLFAGFSLAQLKYYYYLVFIIVIFSIVIIRRIELSRIGRAWIAIKENEIAASSMGINTTKYKLYAFTFGTFWAGIAGILFSAKMQFVSPESFTFMESILILSMIILGGIGNTYGAIIGAFILVILPEVLREVQLYRMLILGIGLVFLMIFRPQGILGGAKGVYFRG